MIGSDSPFRQRMRAEMDAQLTKEYERRDKEEVVSLKARIVELELQRDKAYESGYYDGVHSGE